MNCNILVTKHFSIEIKKYLKKFLSLKDEIKILKESLITNPKQGISLGSKLFKIRLANKSKGAGKSGGFRVITYLVEEKETSCDIYLITLYDKSEEETIDKRDLIMLVKSIIS